MIFPLLDECRVNGREIDLAQKCHMVAGGFDCLINTRVADMNTYRAFAGTVLWQLPCVRETRTYAVTEVKNFSELHIASA